MRQNLSTAVVCAVIRHHHFDSAVNWRTALSFQKRISELFNLFHSSLISFNSPNYKWFPWSICNSCGMQAGNAYSSGHLVPSLGGLHILWLLRPLFPTLHRINERTEPDIHRIKRGFPGAIATGVTCQQWALNLPDTWFRPSYFGLTYAPIVETRFLELAISLLDFSPWIPLGTFSIFLENLPNYIFI